MNEEKLKLTGLIENKKSQSEITRQIVIMSQRGMPINEIRDTFNEIVEAYENQFTESYSDEIDDITAALEGWCSSEFALHPKQLNKVFNTHPL